MRQKYLTIIYLILLAVAVNIVPLVNVVTAETRDELWSVYLSSLFPFVVIAAMVVITLLLVTNAVQYYSYWLEQKRNEENEH